MNQISNICFNQTCVKHDADNVVTLFYSDQPSMGTSAELIDFKVYQTKHTWKELVAEADKDFQQNEKRVISLLHTPKCFGGQRFQVLFFEPQSNSSPDSFKLRHICHDGMQWP